MYSDLVNFARLITKQAVFLVVLQIQQILRITFIKKILLLKYKQFRKMAHLVPFLSILSLERQDYYQH